MSLPSGFCYVEHPKISAAISYATADNFTNRAVAGYENTCIILTEAARDALFKVLTYLSHLDANYGLIIFDAYRPVRAVQDFINWSKNDDSTQKNRFYPRLTKAELFSLGYINSRSKHSNGSTVDLSLTRNHQALDMGTCFDFFDEQAHTHTTHITSEHKAHRMILLRAMEQAGFINLPQEWWHYTLQNEPFPDTFFDFPVA